MAIIFKISNVVLYCVTGKFSAVPCEVGFDETAKRHLQVWVFSLVRSEIKLGCQKNSGNDRNRGV